MALESIYGLPRTEAIGKNHRSFEAEMLNTLDLCPEASMFESPSTSTVPHAPRTAAIAQHFSRPLHSKTEEVK
jgi:hypothetical protein